MKVFVDGSAGTTGLRIIERLSARKDVDLIALTDEDRKKPEKRKEAIFESDVTFLCLPDDAARESVSLAKGSNAVIIDASTAHRVDPDFAYGFAELSLAHRNRIVSAKRISVPGCHASGFIALVEPLTAAGILTKDACLTCHSITGYSGGGKKMIAQYEEGEPLLKAPRQYALGQTHKHLKEMKVRSGLDTEPIFCPIVSDFYSGMVVSVPVFKSQLAAGKGMTDIKEAYKALYTGPMVKYTENMDEDGFISGCALSGRDIMEIAVFGNEDRILLVARFDNLGKGASGAAIQCMNLAMGAAETESLVL